MYLCTSIFKTYFGSKISLMKVIDESGVFSRTKSKKYSKEQYRYWNFSNIQYIESTWIAEMPSLIIECVCWKNIKLVVFVNFDHWQSKFIYNLDNNCCRANINTYIIWNILRRKFWVYLTVWLVDMKIRWTKMRSG